jgi:hypothetical protein
MPYAGPLCAFVARLGRHGPRTGSRRQPQGGARADPMAEPFGAKGSGGSLRCGSEMSNASAGDATRQRARAVYHAGYFFHFQPGYLHAAWGQPLTMAVGRRFSTCRFCDTVIAKSLEMPEYPANEGLSPGFAKMRGPWTLSTTEAIVFALLVLAIAGAGTWASAIG